MNNPSRDDIQLELFKADPGHYIEKAIKDYVLSSPLNRMVDFGNKPFFGEPVIVFADGDDEVFQNIKKTVSASHLTPREILEKGFRLRMVS